MELRAGMTNRQHRAISGGWRPRVVCAALLAWLAPFVVCPGAASAQMYDPEYDALPPAPIPHRPPPYYDPRDEPPPFEPDFDEPRRARRPAKIIERPFDAPPPRRQATVAPPEERGKARPRPDGNRPVQMAPPAPPQKNRAPGKPSMAEDRSPQTPRTPPRLSLSPAPAPVPPPRPETPAAAEPPAKNAATSAGLDRKEADGTGFVNRGEAKINLD